MWIPAHQELGDHPKVKRMASMLNIPPTQVIGHLLYLWWWALSYAKAGSLAAFKQTDIAEAARWGGKPDEFVRALVACGGSGPGFLDLIAGELSLHDWFQYGGKGILARAKKSFLLRVLRERVVPGYAESAYAEYFGEDMTEEDYAGIKQLVQDFGYDTAGYAVKWAVSHNIRDPQRIRAAAITVTEKRAGIHG